MRDKLKELVAKLADDIWAISDGTTPDKGTLRAMISCRLENAPQVGINGLKNLEESWRAWARDNSRGQDWANPAAAAKLVCADELEALLAEQAPAGESASPKPENVKWLIDASNQVISELGKQEHLDSDTFRWLCNAVGQIERDLRQSSQPVEPRDPAAK